MTEEPEYEDMSSTAPNWREQLEDLPGDQRDLALRVVEQVSPLMIRRSVDDVAAALRSTARDADLDQQQPWIQSAAEAIHRGELVFVTSYEPDPTE